MASRSELRDPLIGIWLSAESVQTRIESLVMDMLAPNLPSRVLREAELEELRRGVKLADVALEYLGVRTITIDGDGNIPLRIVASYSPRDPWREALVVPEGDRPIGLVINTADAGPVVRVLLPNASHVTVIARDDGRTLGELAQIRYGLFAGFVTEVFNMPLRRRRK